MFDVRTEIDLENMSPFDNNEGKNSTVFLADDKQLKHQFIVKRISKQSIFDDFGNNNEENLYLESSILYQVSHPNITEIQYASSDDDYIYMVMPYYKNGSMQALLNRRNLIIREFIKYCLDFLCGLLFVHSNKLVHFDIKPTNILINNNGKASLTDFGLAKYTNDLTELAKPNKMYIIHWPPEFFISREMGLQADVYQAGMTMYRMINGNEIWEKQCTTFRKGQIKDGTFPDRKFYLPHIPQKIRKIINKCLNIDIDKRYNSILDVINDLSSIDCTFDWQYKRISSDIQEWHLIDEKMDTCICLTQIGNTFDILTTKTNINSTRTTKILDMCKSKISKDSAYKMISEFTK